MGIKATANVAGKLFVKFFTRRFLPRKTAEKNSGLRNADRGMRNGAVGTAEQLEHRIAQRCFNQGIERNRPAQPRLFLFETVHPDAHVQHLARGMSLNEADNC